MNNAGAKGGGVVNLPPTARGSVYRISQALRAVSNVRVVLQQGVKVRCTGDPGAMYNEGLDPTGADTRQLGQWPTYSCVLFGGYESINFARLLQAVPPYSISGTAAGDRTVQLAERRQSVDFAVGDVIAIDTSSTYQVGNKSSLHPVPRQRQMNVVTSVEQGVIGLRDPIEIGQASAQLLRLTNGARRPGWPTMLNASGGDTRIPLWATHDAQFVGGSWEGAEKRPFSTGSGAIDCRVEAQSIVSGFDGAGYGNLFAKCRFVVEEESAGAGPLVELSAGSHDNTVRVGRAHTDSTTRVIGLNESARNNQVEFGSIILDGQKATDVVQIWNAYNNTVHVKDITGASVTGAVVSIKPWDFYGSPDADDNRVIVDHVGLHNEGRLVSVSASRQHNNIVGGAGVSGAGARP